MELKIWSTTDTFMKMNTSQVIYTSVLASTKLRSQVTDHNNIVGHCSIDKNWDKHEFHLKLTLYFGLWFGLGDTISVVYLL